MTISLFGLGPVILTVFPSSSGTVSKVYDPIDLKPIYQDTHETEAAAKAAAIEAVRKHLAGKIQEWLDSVQWSDDEDVR